MQVTFGDAIFAASGAHAPEALRSELFKDWISSIDPDFRIKQINFDSVDFVSRSLPEKRVLFIKLHATVETKEGKPISGIVFLRGGSVAMLLVLLCEGVEYGVLVRQSRFPVGKIELPELTAGMLDQRKDSKGVASIETMEEVGIEVKSEEFVDLTEMLYGDRWPGIYPSAGGCDEFVQIFLYRTEVTRAQMEAIEKREMGVGETERIRLRTVPLDRLPFETPDAKALSACFLYDLYKKGLLKKGGEHGRS